MRMFLGYSQKDSALKDALLEHLSVIEHTHQLDIWTEERILPGSDWHEDIATAIRSSSIALLLVSSSFLASIFAKNKAFGLLVNELSLGVRVVPILLRHCTWEHHPVLGRLNPLPRNRVAINAYSGDRRDKALSDICREIVAWATKTEQSRSEQTAGRVLPLPPEEVLRQLRAYDELHPPPSTPLPAPPSLPNFAMQTSSPHQTQPLPISSGPMRLQRIDQASLRIFDFSNNDPNGYDVRLRHNPTIVGRDPECHIVIANNGVSRRHAILELAAGRLFLRDAGSTNGTFCNKQLVGGGTVGSSQLLGEITLRPGDSIHLGPSVLCVLRLHDFTTIPPDEELA